MKTLLSWVFGCYKHKLQTASVEWLSNAADDIRKLYFILPSLLEALKCLFLSVRNEHNLKIIGSA